MPLGVACCFELGSTVTSSLGRPVFVLLQHELRRAPDVDLWDHLHGFS